jgi:hypothetical protein
MFNLKEGKNLDFSIFYHLRKPGRGEEKEKQRRKELF